MLSLLAQALLRRIMGDKLEVTLAIEQELLIGVTLLLGLFDSPLLAEHLLLLRHKFLFFLSLHLTRVLLPVKDGHRVSDLLLFLTSLGHLSFEFLLGVKLPKLGVDLLLHHFGLNVAAFVNQLLLTLDGRSIVVELGIFFSQSII